MSRFVEMIRRVVERPGRRRGTRRAGLGGEQPLRAELFSIAQLRDHAARLAGWHRIDPSRQRDPLLPRLDENRRVLLETYDVVSTAAKEHRSITPAGEWLVDNYYLIEEQIRTTQRHLPRSYSRELPHLARGPLAGYPRVYDIAQELISHLDGRVDAESLSVFVEAYQVSTPLTLGELWAIPIMLRLALIENLRRVATRIAAGRADFDAANAWADEIVLTAEKDPKNVILVLADMARANPPSSSAFIAEFTRRLQGQGASLVFVITWIEQRLSELGRTIEQLVQEEAQRQAGDHVSISNTIGSLRFLDGMDWREFVETVSVVEQTLRDDPADVYSDMDFGTRDAYRHVVERLARRSGIAEQEVAGAAITMAREAAGRETGDGRAGHVGYYLVDDGLPLLRRRLRVPLTPGAACAAVCRRWPLLIYLSFIALLTCGATGALVAYALRHGTPVWLAAVAGALLFICASQVAVAVVNWLVTLTVTPQPLPRLDFLGGVPPDACTLVAVPCLLTSEQDINTLAEALEVRYLANRDDHVYFALATDFTDAPEERMPDDERLVQAAEARIEALNAAYPREQGTSFFLFHRARRWNSRERVWMGYERKRGKLAELNALLRGRGRGSFTHIVGDTTMLPRVRYVITLDADTRLPRDAARMLAGTMAHPLNRPEYDGQRERVVRGYGVLQPRVGISMPGGRRSLFVRLFAGEPGIDPYTRAVSDVYQDLFHEGSFIGKGIYDVDAFERATAGRFPDNLILSHDLIEGSHARAALVSDVLLIEEYPARYTADTSRRHRWMRGDWQIAAWLLPRVPGADGRWRRNPLTLLSQWKILDNMRRSLVPPGLFALLVLSVSFLEPAWLWAGAGALMVFMPSVLTCLQQALSARRDIPLGLHARSAFRAFARSLGEGMFMLVCLPYEAYLSADAIARTLVRMCIVHRGLLEWTTSSEAVRNACSTLAGFYRCMWCAPVAACVALPPALCLHPNVAAVALPLLGMWLVSPALAWWISRPLRPPAPRLSARQDRFLRAVSRRTWRFFETFVGPDDHWLPPDNFQEEPVSAVAHRTSPTNIGLALLANLGAWDLGYISTSRLLERTANTFATMAGLERFRGHFYNWYDTHTLHALTPLYVSTVDSGNLAGHLLTLQSGLEALGRQPVINAHACRGLADTLCVFLDTLKGHAPDGAAAASIDIPDALVEECAALCDEFAHPPHSLSAWHALLGRCAGVAGRLVHAAGADVHSDASWWARAFERHCSEFSDELAALAPWAPLVAGPAPGLPPGAAELMAELDRAPVLNDVAAMGDNAAPRLAALLGALVIADAPPGGQPAQPQDAAAHLARVHAAVLEGAARAADLTAQCRDLAAQCMQYADAEYGFLYDPVRRLLSIGYNAREHRLDASYYDLLASEARLCSFVAIAQGKLPQEHWFSLGRSIIRSHGRPLLLAWDGSMFEYLMPQLVMPSFEGSLLDETCKAAVERHIAYGRQQGVPWGISESGYNAVNINLNYEYRSFGVPGLGFRRGLAADVVVAPYATAMALVVAPGAASDNLERLAGGRLLGRYGFYEAVDYTPSRMASGQASAVVRSYMAHHQGMSLLGLVSVLAGRPMQRRFSAQPAFRATELLLEERIPRVAPVRPHVVETGPGVALEGRETHMRTIANPATPVPEVHLLSNGRYSVMITNAGGGYSRWKDLAVSRWREDTTRDAMGSFCYLRDVGSRRVWSATHQPTLKRARSYETIFSQARAEFRRRDRDLVTHTQVAVSPEDDIELRRITLMNIDRAPRTIELTSYAEIVLAPPAAEATHPMFSGLFVETEIVRELQAILCHRRARSHKEQHPWLVHLMRVHGSPRRPLPVVGDASYETDRAAFIGRGRSAVAPAAMAGAGPLSNTDGPVLDPVAAIRTTVVIEPDDTVTIDLTTGIGETRDAALLLARKYHDRYLADRVFDMAWTHSQVILRQLNASEAEAQLYGRLAGAVIYAHSLRRATAGILAKNRRSQSDLWAHGISGDLPIVLLRVSDTARIEIVRQVVQAHAYWRLKGLSTDLVIWNEDRSGYRQLLQDSIMGIISAGTEAHLLDQHGGIFVRREEQVSEEDRIMFQSFARVVLSDSAGTLEDQVSRRGRPELGIPQLAPERARRAVAPPAPAKRDLVLFNGYGGFTRDGREYVVLLAPGVLPPAPWCNVIANARLGTVVTESGGAYTWHGNAHEFRLTPWHNDPVTDASGEALYVRDEETGALWSPTPLPVCGAGQYVSRHGFGYSVFEHTEDGIETELWVYVAADAPVKFSVLRLRNTSGRPRRLTVTGYVEWVLGELQAKSRMHVVTELDPKTGALMARNSYGKEFAGHVAFFAVSQTAQSVTADREEFLGRNHSSSHPAGLGRTHFSGRTGPALDPCAAIQAGCDLGENDETEIAFVLGAGSSLDEARALVQQHRSASAARRALEAVWASWNRTLGAVFVETPEPAVNFLANGWLPYQTLSCRLWARSGYCQSGGAYGFRDQLQDAMALVHAAPGVLREHLLRCAAHQFVQGDVQHWWHPPADRGVRSHCSDDYLWLPLATCRYVACTGDTGVLDERVPFLEGRPVNPEEEAYYDLPIRSEQSATLYEHCTRALMHGLARGSHGLPLIGTGDWNDGMNLVGERGQGESVWLAFFLFHVLTEFSALARRHDDDAFAGRCDAEAKRLRDAVEEAGWDGKWYLRAFFDSGAPLGSASGAECRIDSLPQSWAVISGAGSPERARMALEQARRELVRRDASLIQLLDPPFDKCENDPGYIKGYPPGVRENGGQYTHAAAWLVMAHALLGDARNAWDLLGVINPVNHGSSPEQIGTYRVEPYVVAADVYACPPHTGRGGWTWYTGAAGWLYRTIIESLLGLRREGTVLRIVPCIPPDWPPYKIHYRYRDTVYHLIITPGGECRTVARLTVDGVDQEDKAVHLADDRVDHNVSVELA